MSFRTRFPSVFALAFVLAPCLMAAPAMAQVIATAQPLPRYTINATARALDSIADITGDGIRDLILGNPDADQVQLRNGRNGNLIAQFNGPSNTSFGFDVASTGDVDGDGLEDVLIGAPDAQPDGLAFIYSSATFAPIRTWGPSSAGASEPALYGYSVSRAGQLDGAGAEEVLVGAPMFDPTGTSRPGLVEAVDVTPPATALMHTIVGMAAWEQFGDSLANLGDVDGDAVDDFIVGATWFFGPNGTSPGTVPGLARIYSGASMTFPPGFEVLIQQLNGFSAADAFGFAVAGIGDLDNDGAGDWLVGAPDFAQLSVPLVDTAFYTIPSPTSPALYCLHFGHAVSGVGDYNGNGFEDFVVGAPSRFGGCGAAGRVYLYEGRNASVIFQLSAPGASGEYGWDVTELDQVGNRTLIAVTDPAAGRVHVF